MDSSDIVISEHLSWLGLKDFNKFKQQIELYIKNINIINKVFYLGCVHSHSYSSLLTVKYLVHIGIDINDVVNSDTDPPLMMSCMNTGYFSSMETVRYLVEIGANINYKNKHGWTALDYAYKYRNTFSTEQTVLYLLQCGTYFGNLSDSLLEQYDEYIIINNNRQLVAGPFI